MVDHSLLGFKELHWMMGMLQDIEVGLVVLDHEYRIQVWNSFMENHSGMGPIKVKGQVLFSLFDEIHEKWFRNKTEPVFLLKNKTFTTWEQRPYLFRFRNYRPITGTEPFMYQNITVSPLVSANGEVNHICLIIYDVTDIAINKSGLEKANHQLEELSRTDRLTTLFNRGYWEECLQREFFRFIRTHETSCLVMFDIDHFKKVNDTYGHPAGDAVISTVATKLKDNLRSSDIAGRYGGEEFSVILVNTDSPSALYFTERLRKSIEKTIVTHEGRDISVTISLGIAQIIPEIQDYKVWLERTDQALYQSKQNGRNQSTIYDTSKK
ncbi:sensor domain-containing diguanylate cyclase [Zooshikella harenae]|nr:sensor domain-containing diguanylate cyclase [Zooshikella harenae]